jgi:hypothetical protein
MGICLTVRVHWPCEHRQGRVDVNVGHAGSKSLNGVCMLINQKVILQFFV